jgi:hypothetical protein
MLHDLELYKEYYEGSNRADAQWQLIFSDDPAEIKSLEGIVKMSQAAAVDDFIETSCWKDDLTLRGFVGKKGTADDRLHGLRFAYLLQNSRLSMQTDYSLLTPLEHSFLMLVWKMEEICTDPALKKRAQFLLKDAARIADRARERWWKQLEAWREEEDVPFDAAIDATSAETLEEFVDIVAKDSPKIASALRKDLAAQRKKKGRRKTGPDGDSGSPYRRNFRQRSAHLGRAELRRL